MVAYNIGNEEPAIILKDKNKFENLKPTIWYEEEGHTIISKGTKNIKYYVKDFENSLIEL